jgi:hypothetical protein
MSKIKAFAKLAEAFESAPKYFVSQDNIVSTGESYRSQMKQYCEKVFSAGFWSILVNVMYFYISESSNR